MAKLTSKKRRKLPAKDFALPGKRYPVEDKAHARAALSRVSQHGTAEEKAKVRKKVSAKYPTLNVKGLQKGKGKKDNKARKRVRVKA